MRTRRRRRLDAALLVGGALAAGAAATVGAASGDSERVADYWVAAEVDDGGSATITEVIDYDFGAEERRGIFLDVRDLEPTATVRVESPTAPDQFELSSAPDGGTRIRIGDPDITITGRHRYRISYPLDVANGTGGIHWNAVGTHWEVDIHDAEIHVVGANTLVDPSCLQGPPESTGACRSTEDAAPGHLVVTTGKIPAGEGVTIYTGQGAPVDALAALTPPSGPAEDPGSDLGGPLLAGTLGALVSGAGVSRVIRRAGRERVTEGGAADAAWGHEPGGAGERRVDHEDLAELATIEFAPPSGLSPAQGGIVLREAVYPEHKVAWLIGAAIDGYVDLEPRGSKVVLRRTGRHDGEAAALLAPAFEGRHEIELGRYDPKFAGAWAQVGTSLEQWSRAGELWDPKADTRRTWVRILGIVALVAGGLMAAGGGALAAGWHARWLVLVAVGGLVAGAGVAAVVRAWELRVRTPTGTAAWLRVESFRRFLAGSEAEHARQAADMGVLREYTAWAVAVGEVRRWSSAVAAAAIPAATAGVAYATMAPSLTRATQSASTAPSSSSSGGGGGGGVGGGSGGSGGGSW